MAVKNVVAYFDFGPPDGSNARIGLLSTTSPSTADEQFSSIMSTTSATLAPSRTVVSAATGTTSVADPVSAGIDVGAGTGTGTGMTPAQTTQRSGAAATGRGGVRTGAVVLAVAAAWAVALL